MNLPSRILSPRYQTALRRYLRQGASASLQPASRLGRRAVTQGLETLDLALIHEQALLAQVLSTGDPAARERIIQRAQKFFAEAIRPMEEMHCAVLEANVRLHQLNRTLRRRTRELAASGRQLKKENARRLAVVESLRQSEQQAS